MWIGITLICISILLLVLIIERHNLTKSEKEANLKLSLLIQEKEQIRSELEHKDRRLSMQKEELVHTQGLLREEELNRVRFEEQINSLEKQVKGLLEEKELVSDKLKTDFQEVMYKLLKDRGEGLEEANNQVLLPLREEIKAFKEQVEKSYVHEREQRTSLQNEIKNLMERSQLLSQEAHQLSVALRGNSKVQGDWGEMILETILERSGLVKDVNYVLQETVRDENGKLFRPDVIIKYPDNKNIIIDSKVSLNAYVDYVNAEEEDAKTEASQRHLISVQNHFNELANKNYSDLIDGSPDFVLMFIPNEQAYNLALSLNPKLWEEAYQKRVILINAPNLITALRMVMDMWRRDKQIKNVTLITKKAADMYDKFVSIEQSFLSMEKSLQSAVNSVEKTKTQLLDGRGNLKRRMEDLKEIGGLMTKKSLSISEDGL